MAAQGNASNEGFSRTTNNPVGTSFTMMGWFYRMGTSGAWPFLLGIQVTSQYLNLELDAASGNAISLWDGSTNYNSGPMVLNTWYHLTILSSGTGGTDCKMYINGVLAQSGLGRSGGVGLYVSRSPVDPAFYFNGRVAAVKIWDRALTAAQVKSEMWTTRPVETWNINSWHPLWDTITGRDASPQARHLTVTGALSWADNPPGVVYENRHVPNRVRPRPFAPGLAR